MPRFCVNLPFNTSLEMKDEYADLTAALDRVVRALQVDYGLGDRKAPTLVSLLQVDPVYIPMVEARFIKIPPPHTTLPEKLEFIVGGGCVFERTLSRPHNFILVEVVPVRSRS